MKDYPSINLALFLAVHMTSPNYSFETKRDMVLMNLNSYKPMKEEVFKMCWPLISQFGWKTYPWDPCVCEKHTIDYHHMLSLFPDKNSLILYFLQTLVCPLPIRYETLKDDLFENIMTSIEALSPHRLTILEIGLTSSFPLQKDIFLQLISLFAASAPQELSQPVKLFHGTLMTIIYLRAVLCWSYHPLETVMVIVDQWITKLLPLFSLSQENFASLWTHLSPKG
jgi:hypothetical protein